MCKVTAFEKKKGYRVVISQPGIEFHRAKALKESIEADNRIASLSNVFLTDLRIENYGPVL